MSEYRLERGSGGSWYQMGLEASNIMAMGRIMNAIDPEGTQRLRVWDIVADDEVSDMEMVRDHVRTPLEAQFLNRKVMEVIERVNWINHGF